MHKRLLYAACLLSVATGAGAVDAPSVLNQTGYDGQSLTLSWSPVEGATGYQVSVWTLGTSVSEARDVNLVINKDNPTLYTPAVDGHLDEAVLTFSVSGTDGVEAGQTLPLIFRQADAEHQISSIFRGDIFVGQLAAYNQVSSNSVFGGYPLDEFTECLYIQAGPQGEQPSAPGTLTITRVENTYRPNVYLKKDETVGAAETTLHITGMDPALNYYAAVKAVKDDDVSLPSEILHLDGVLPTLLTGATDFTSESYTANWEANPKGYSYAVTNYEIIKAPDSAPLELVIMEDSFDKATEGTFESPVERIDADDYTGMPGWTVKSAIAAKGMFGTFDGMVIAGRNYGGGEMATPPLGFADGDATVSLRLQSSKPGEDEILVYVGEYNPDAVTVLPVPADGIVEQTVTLSGVCDGATVHIDSRLLKKFMLDNIKISQTLQPGQQACAKRESATVNDATSFTFTGLNPDSEYGYTVRTDYQDFFGLIHEGPESEMKEVGSFAGVENVITDAGNLSPVVSVIFTDLAGRRLLVPAPGTIVIRTEIHADGSRTSSRFIMR